MVFKKYYNKIKNENKLVNEVKDSNLNTEDIFDKIYYNQIEK